MFANYRKETMEYEDYTVIDIETIPNESMIDKLPEPEVKLGNTKDPVKVAAKIEEAKRTQVAKMALNPLYGRVCCAAMIKGEDVNYVIDNVDCDNIERGVIRYIAESLGESTRICTWNGNNFDLPFIYKRAMILGVDIMGPLSYWTKRYNVSPHCDLMNVWTGWNGLEKLDNVARAILGEGKDKHDVTRNNEYMKTGEGREKLIEYNIKDVKLTQSLLKKFIGKLI